MINNVDLSSRFFTPYKIQGVVNWYEMFLINFTCYVVQSQVQYTPFAAFWLFLKMWWRIVLRGSKMDHTEEIAEICFTWSTCKTGLLENREWRTKVGVAARKKLCLKMGKLNVSLIRYMSKEDFRILTAVSWVYFVRFYSRIERLLTKKSITT